MCAGRSHSAAWSVTADSQDGEAAIPTHIPAQYTALQGVPYVHLHNRLLLLNNFSNLIYTCWRLLNLYPDQEDLGRFNSGERVVTSTTIRSILSPRVFSLPLIRAIGKTMVQGKNYGPQITVKRITSSGYVRLRV